MLTLDNVVGELTKGDLIVQSYQYKSVHEKFWKIEKPIEVLLSNGEIITIPHGFVYDMATVPKWLWSVVRPFNDALMGTLIHDFLYIDKASHTMTRAQADAEYLKWNNTTNSNKLDNYTRYIFVRAFGWAWWN